LVALGADYLASARVEHRVRARLAPACTVAALELLVEQVQILLPAERRMAHRIDQFVHFCFAKAALATEPVRTVDWGFKWAQPVPP
jgi:hypothetical protein